jgi:hypothetical protein
MYEEGKQKMIGMAEGESTNGGEQNVERKQKE